MWFKDCWPKRSTRIRAVSGGATPARSGFFGWRRAAVSPLQSWLGEGVVLSRGASPTGAPEGARHLDGFALRLQQGECGVKGDAVPPRCRAAGAGVSPVARAAIGGAVLAPTSLPPTPRRSDRTLTLTPVSSRRPDPDGFVGCVNGSELLFGAGSDGSDDLGLEVALGRRVSLFSAGLEASFDNSSMLRLSRLGQPELLEAGGRHAEPGLMILDEAQLATWIGLFDAAREALRPEPRGRVVGPFLSLTAGSSPNTFGWERMVYFGGDTPQAFPAKYPPPWRAGDVFRATMVVGVTADRRVVVRLSSTLRDVSEAPHGHHNLAGGLRQVLFAGQLDGLFVPSPAGAPAVTPVGAARGGSAAAADALTLPGSPRTPAIEIKILGFDRGSGSYQFSATEANAICTFAASLSGFPWHNYVEWPFEQPAFLARPKPSDW